MNQLEIAEIAKQHWKNWCPKTHKQLVRENRLDAEAQAAAKLTLMEMENYTAIGMSEHEAWVESRGIFVLTDPQME